MANASGATSTLEALSSDTFVLPPIARISPTKSMNAGLSSLHSSGLSHGTPQLRSDTSSGTKKRSRTPVGVTALTLTPSSSSTSAASATAGAERPLRKFVLKTHRENDYSSEEEEEEEDYRKGGYHPVQLGNVFNERYQIEAKLGWGHFSTVWLAHDRLKNTNVALKIVKSARNYTEAARDEIKILEKIAQEDPNNTSCVIRLLDQFQITGPHGTHVSMVFEKLGCNLLTLIRMYRYKGLPIPLVRIFTKQLLIGVAYLHKCQIIHSDLKPENLLMVKTPLLIKKLSTEERTRLNHLAREPSAIRSEPLATTHCATESSDFRLHRPPSCDKRVSSKSPSHYTHHTSPSNRKPSSHHSSPANRKSSHHNSPSQRSSLHRSTPITPPSATPTHIVIPFAEQSSNRPASIRTPPSPLPTYVVPPFPDNSASQSQHRKVHSGTDPVSSGRHFQPLPNRVVLQPLPQLSASDMTSGGSPMASDDASLHSFLDSHAKPSPMLMDFSPAASPMDISVSPGTLMLMKRSESDNSASPSVMMMNSRVESEDTSFMMDLNEPNSEEPFPLAAKSDATCSTVLSLSQSADSHHDVEDVPMNDLQVSMPQNALDSAGAFHVPFENTPIPSSSPSRPSGEFLTGSHAVSAPSSSAASPLNSRMSRTHSSESLSGLSYHLSTLSSPLSHGTTAPSTHAPALASSTSAAVAAPHFSSSLSSSSSSIVAPNSHASTTRYLSSSPQGRVTRTISAESLTEFGYFASASASSCSPVSSRSSSLASSPITPSLAYQHEMNSLINSPARFARHYASPKYTSLHGGAMPYTNPAAGASASLISPQFQKLNIQSSSATASPVIHPNAHALDDLHRNHHHLLDLDDGNDEESSSDSRVRSSSSSSNSSSSSSCSSRSTLSNESEGKSRLPWARDDILTTFSKCCRIKIVDLGNACWTYKHFTDDVQTRQYRAPEIILGSKYDQSIDVWSVACICFELITGDLLFEPKAGRSFDKNDVADHLAQMQELLGRMPRHVALGGKYSRNFFTRRGELRYIKSLKMWHLKDVLTEKYHLTEDAAHVVTDFLLPMLSMDPQRRVSAEEALNHPWLRSVDITRLDSAFD